MGMSQQGRYIITKSLLIHALNHLQSKYMNFLFSTDILLNDFLSIAIFILRSVSFACCTDIENHNSLWFFSFLKKFINFRFSFLYVALNRRDGVTDETHPLWMFPFKFNFAADNNKQIKTKRFQIREKKWTCW